MSDDSNTDDKTEDPTDKRREDARSKGQVALSREMSSAGVLIAAGLGIALTWPRIREGSAGVMRHYLREATLNPEAFLTDPVLTVTEALGTVIHLCGPMLLVTALASLAAVAAQVGITWNPGVLSPDWSRLDPVAGLKQKMFSDAAFSELVRNLLKVGIVGWISWRVLEEHIPTLQEVGGRDLQGGLSWVWTVAWQLVAQTLLAMLVLGGADVAFVRWQHERKLRMSRHQVKEESKESEGDPYVKGRIRRTMQDMSKKRLAKDMVGATVVVTNPTHYAVALQYELGQDGPPKVLASGVDEKARRIQEIARERSVPRVENRPLARALYARCRPGHHIPPELFEGVAEVLAFVFKMRRRHAPAQHRLEAAEQAGGAAVVDALRRKGS